MTQSREVQIGPCRLINADCRKALKVIEASSVDSILTDPPYGLGFMGKGWDHGVPGVEFWIEALRVAKPGAMLLAFGGTRTFHRLACAIEDAGWELRDTIMWVYGSGFPKSLDISKAIDKAAGVEREDKFEGAFERRSGPTGNKRCDACGKWLVSGSPCQCPRPQDLPQTNDAKQWSGWGTALKPAWEPIIVAMKPLDGTFANNALTHGVAGLNIDGGRIEGRERTEYGLATSTRTTKNTYGEAGNSADFDSTKGRFPANLIHDGSDEVLALFPETGKSTGGTASAGRFSNKYGSFSGDNPGSSAGGFGDSGSASRFFYCAKASSSERGDGNTHPTVKPLALMEYLCKLTRTPTGGVVLDMFAGSGTTGVACVNTGRRFIGLESDTSCGYFDIATNRIQRAWDEMCSELSIEKQASPRQLSMFGDED